MDSIQLLIHLKAHLKIKMYVCGKKLPMKIFVSIWGYRLQSSWITLWAGSFCSFKQNNNSYFGYFSLKNDSRLKNKLSSVPTKGLMMETPGGSFTYRTGRCKRCRLKYIYKMLVVFAIQKHTHKKWKLNVVNKVHQ